MTNDHEECRLVLDDVSIWLEDKSSIMFKAVTTHGDPVELTAGEARRIVACLNACIAVLDADLATEHE